VLIFVAPRTPSITTKAKESFVPIRVRGLFKAISRHMRGAAFATVVPCVRQINRLANEDIAVPSQPGFIFKEAVISDLNSAQ
jgi:hypothetical protein